MHGHSLSTWALAVILATTSASSIMAGEGDRDARIEKEMQTLKGTWWLERAVAEGERKQAEPRSGSFTLTSYGRFTFTNQKQGGAVAVGFFSIDPTLDTKTIDFLCTEGQLTVPGTTLGIYKLEGDTLWVCIGTMIGNRPLRFNAEANSHNALLILKREEGK